MFTGLNGTGATLRCAFEGDAAAYCPSEQQAECSVLGIKTMGSYSGQWIIGTISTGCR